MEFLVGIDIIRLLLVVALLYVSYVDLCSFRIPNAITLPLIFGGWCFNYFSIHPIASIEASLIGAALGYVILWGANRIYLGLKKQNGIGMGDAKLLAALGAWLGWTTLPGLLLIASLSGALGGMIYLWWNKQHFQNAFPFGPFLAFAGIIGLLWPQTLQILLPIY